ncbi:MAG: hypothetical protein WCD18_05740 [Thermosynechococcaceae cyanobacterium]
MTDKTPVHPAATALKARKLKTTGKQTVAAKTPRKRSPETTAAQ